MNRDKTKHQSFQEQAKGVFVEKGALDEKSKLFFLKKSMDFSTKDIVIIFCLAVIIFVLEAATIYIKPLEFFNILSQEQMRAIVQENLKKSWIENFQTIFMGMGSLNGMPLKELWRVAGWNGVGALICLLPNVILGTLVTLFPGFFCLYMMLNRALKEMIQHLEKTSLEQSSGKSDKQATL